MGGWSVLNKETTYLLTYLFTYLVITKKL